MDRRWCLAPLRRKIRAGLGCAGPAHRAGHVRLRAAGDRSGAAGGRWHDLYESFSVFLEYAGGEERVMG